MRACAIVPAFDAERTVAEVVRELVSAWPHRDAVIVVDDGSADATADAARVAGARVLRHAHNRGKGAALRTGLELAAREGFDVAVTVDADGQHPTAEALALLGAELDPAALVLGIRDLEAAGAPRANRISNGISNFFLSVFAGRRLRDTQCGLRRYPVESTLALGGSAEGYAFEAEIILCAVAAGVRIVEVPVRVVYPPEGTRVTHFDSVRDPARIVGHVVRTVARTRLSPTPPRVPRSAPGAGPGAGPGAEASSRARTRPETPRPAPRSDTPVP
jgi:glycosyltransferase involved in cell wall biosynthesis